jgi:hypothetical protein
VILPQERRKQDALNRLEHDTDAWMAWREENELEGRELMRGEHKIPSRTARWSWGRLPVSPFCGGNNGCTNTRSLAS